MNLSSILILVTFALQGSGDVPAKYNPHAPAKDKVLAKVNGKEIKAEDVEDLLWQWRGQEALADLTSYQMMKDAATKRNVSVTDDEVEKAMTAQLAQVAQGMPAGANLDDYILSQGFTKSRFWMRLKTQLLLDKMAAVDFKATDYVKISSMVVKPESITSASLQNAAKKADLFYDKLIKGAKWEDVLNLSTTDTNVLDAKGLLGWRRIDAFPEVVRNELLTLKPGGYTKPAQMPSGFQIFRLEMFGKDAKGKDLDDAIAIHAVSNRAKVLEKIRSESKVERIPQNS